MKPIRRLAGGALLAVLAALSTARGASAATLVDCVRGASGGDHLRRPFYVQRFPGTSLTSVTIVISSTGSGEHTFTMTARAGTMDGTVIGTATTTVTLSGGYPASEGPVTFTFAGSPSVEPNSTVAFITQTVSAPADSNQYIGVYTDTEPCPVVLVEAVEPPLSTFRRNGIPVTITGATGAPALAVLTLPASASIHGAGGSFFHSDLWLMNPSPGRVIDVSARFRCFTGMSCGSGTATIHLAPLESRLFADVLAALFGAADSAGAIELVTSGSRRPRATSRVYTPSLPAPTTGATVPLQEEGSFHQRTLFLGLANNGGSLSSGFRTNAGAYNPNGAAVAIVFTLYAADGTQLGTPYRRLFAGYEAYQVNDVFAAVGAGSVVTTNAYLIVSSEALGWANLYPYVTVIDNQSGDSIFAVPLDASSQ